MVDRRRSGLTGKQKTALSRLEKKPRISEYDVGMLRAWTLFAHPEDGKRAEKVLRRHGKETP